MPKTDIEWCDYSWNVVTGCTKISDGCKHCYAERMAKRLAGRGYFKEDPFQITWHDDRIEQPLKWKKPKRIFVCSMGDLFHKDVPSDWIYDVLDVTKYAYWHTFLILTKRPSRMLSFIKETFYSQLLKNSTELQNVWLGVSVENQAAADERIPLLLQTPAAARFVSCEPLLEKIDLSKNFRGDKSNEQSIEGTIRLVICGGETGPGARYMNPDWARSLRDQCKDVVPFFMKQMSKREPIPEDLMVREFPQ
jgi:protein gp37